MSNTNTSILPSNNLTTGVPSNNLTTGILSKICEGKPFTYPLILQVLSITVPTKPDSPIKCVLSDGNNYTSCGIKRGSIPKPFSIIEIKNKGDFVATAVKGKKIINIVKYSLNFNGDGSDITSLIGRPIPIYSDGDIFNLPMPMSVSMNKKIIDRDVKDIKDRDTKINIGCVEDLNDLKDVDVKGDIKGDKISGKDNDVKSDKDSKNIKSENKYNKYLMIAPSSKINKELVASSASSASSSTHNNPNTIITLKQASKSSQSELKLSTLKLRVISKSQVITWTKSTNAQGRRFKIELIDSEGTQIDTTMFDELCDKWFPFINDNQVYNISKFLLKRKNEKNAKYSKNSNDYELGITKDTVFVLDIINSGSANHDSKSNRSANQDSKSNRGANHESKSDGVAIPVLRLTPKKIGDITSCKIGNIIDIIGYIHEVGDIDHITIRGKDHTKRTITLVDDSMCLVNLTIWGKDCDKFNNKSVGRLLGIKNCTISTYRDKLTINIGYNPIFVFEPNPCLDIKEVVALRKWKSKSEIDDDDVKYKCINDVEMLNSDEMSANRKKAIHVINEVKAVIEALKSINNIKKMGDASDAKDNRDTKDIKETDNIKGAKFIDVKDMIKNAIYPRIPIPTFNEYNIINGHVVNIKYDEEATPTYKACPKSGCNKGLIPKEGKYYCGKCNKDYDDYSTLYRLSLVIADESSGINCTAFDSVGKKLTGMNAREFDELREDLEHKKPELERIIHESVSKPYIFKIQTKIVTMENGNITPRFNIISVTDVDVDAENKNMERELKENENE